ncbi:MAG TPA: DUF547 domain-containing protein [Verrucomicrobiae bacterium]|nr:DUF547 domain-containing protein [Verrucomicrobiae bacterium]
MRPTRAPALPFALLLTLLAPACGAPASVAARGEIADEVRAAIDRGRGTFDHAAWGALLVGGTRDGLVDYRWFQAHRAELDAYLDRVATVGLTALSGPQLEALLINAYNALTIRSILDNPSVGSIREIPGVWDKRLHRVGGHDLTLDAIEHNLLRPFYKDPRIHFAVNCASMSCAPLASSAWEGDRLDAQLDAAARRFLTDPRQVRVEGGTLHLSSYFKWYGGDFTAEGWRPRAGSIPGFVAAYAIPDVETAIHDAGGEMKIEFLDYDWKLNASVAPDPTRTPPAVTSPRAGS